MLGPTNGPITDPHLDINGRLPGKAPLGALGQFLQDLHRIDAVHQLCEYCRLIAETGAHVEDTILRLQVQ